TPANNKLRMEDKRGEEHIKLSSEYGGKSQLNLGHIVDANRDKRGEGFELRTDSWGAIRAGKGLFISADNQAKAGGEVLAMDEAIKQLEQALTIAKSLSKSAEISGADVSDANAQNKLKDNLNQLTAPGLLVHAPAGIGLFSPQALYFASAQESVALTANQSINLAANQKVTLNAKKSVSIYAQQKGIKMIAQYGDIILQAQNDALSVLSKKDLDIQSIDGSVNITAKKEIILNCGGGYIKISGGNIEIGTPNNILLKSINVQKVGATNFNSPIPEIQKGFCEQFVIKDKKTQRILPFTPYSVTTEEGDVYTGISDVEGKTVEIFTSTPQKIDVKVEREN
ncbi:DUF2345 domain-containing protein, partial [Proteus mirabilis]|uniref:DUF2345 domain-containing protein n=1 Tax=Proteus mirabilis TaxID=584 RepID=UPI00391D720F